MYIYTRSTYTCIYIYICVCICIIYIYIYIYVWHCPINCFSDLCGKKTTPEKKRKTVPKPNCPGESKETASQPFSQSATQPAAPAGPAGQPISQPARTRSSQAQILGPKWTLSVSGVEPHSVAPDSMSPKSEQTPENKMKPTPESKKNMVPKPSCPGEPKQPASQPFSQPVSHAASSSGRPACQPASQDPEQTGPDPGPRVDPKWFRCGAPERLLQTPFGTYSIKNTTKLGIPRKKTKSPPRKKKE